MLDTHIVYKGWFDLLTIRMKVAGREVDRAMIDHPSGATVLAYDPERRVALTVSEPRAAVVYLGAPHMREAMGGVMAEVDPAECAKREALEEAGVRLNAVECVGRAWMTPSTSTERVSLFLGRYSLADRVGVGGGLDHEQEQVDVLEVPLAELWARVEAGEMMDAKLLLLLQALRIRRPELFEPL